ncbi:MAG: exo-beta-N-acetylmuramidase NamZ family protein [Deinococcota bacterium]
MTGLERLLCQPSPLQHAGRVGLLTHPAGVTRDLLPTAVALLRAGVRLERLYGPEHGIDGSGQAGEAPEIETDRATGLPTHSLYHQSIPQIAERIGQVDTLLVDLQDVGVRFYTFVSTLAQVLEAARQAGVRVVVLDRPNPLGFRVEGPVLEPQFRSFVGALEVPVRHGLTIGECARLVDPTVEVIPCDPLETFGYGGLPWVPPSPNLPTLEATHFYVGMCLVEGTAASEGRGTTLPFQLFGAPTLDAVGLAQRLNSLDLGPVRFRPAYFTPALSKHAGRPCAGVQVHALESLERTLPLGLAVVGALAEQSIELNPDWLQKLLGIPFDPELFLPERALERCLAWEEEARAYRAKLSRAWLYPRG